MFHLYSLARCQRGVAPRQRVKVGEAGRLGLCCCSAALGPRGLCPAARHPVSTRELSYVPSVRRSVPFHWGRQKAGWGCAHFSSGLSSSCAPQGLPDGLWSFPRGQGLEDEPSLRGALLARSLLLLLSQTYADHACGASGGGGVVLGSAAGLEQLCRALGVAAPASPRLSVGARSLLTLPLQVVGTLARITHGSVLSFLLNVNISG